MKNRFLNSVAISIGLAITSNAGVFSDNTEISVQPDANPVPIAIRLVSTNVAKLSWDSPALRAYLVRHKTSLSPQSAWKTLGVQTATENTTRQSTFMKYSADFFKVCDAPAFNVSNSVVLSASFPGVNTNDISNSTLTWAWEDGTIHISPANALVTNLFASAGVKKVTVTVSNSIDGSTASDFFAITVTNKSVQTNLVKNPGFETSSNSLPIGWTRNSWGNNNPTFLYPVSGPAGTNDRAVCVRMTNYTGGDAKWWFDLIPMTPGATYEYRDTYLSAQTTDVTVWFTLTNGSNSYVGLDNPAGATNWQDFATSFIAPSNAASATVFHSAIANGSLTIDNVSLIKKEPVTPLTNALFSFNFDDGWKDMYLTAPIILETNGFRGTFYMLGGYFGYPDYMGTNDTLDLQARGHEIGAHSMNHPDLALEMITNTPAVEWEINACRFALESIGIKSVATFAYPYGSYSPDLARLTKEAGYSGAFIVGDEPNIKGAVEPFMVKRVSILSTTTTNEIAAMVDSAVANKQWLILLFHRIREPNEDEYSVTPDFLHWVIQYVKSKGAPVVTNKEGLRRILLQ